MFRKFIIFCIVAVLALSTSIGPVHAQSKSTGQATFQVVFNPTQLGLASDQAFGNAPVSFGNYLYDFVPEDIFNSSMALKVFRSKDGKNWEYAGMPYSQDPRYNWVLGGFVYQNYLYIALNRDACLTAVPTIPGLVLRTADGKRWEKVFQAPGTDGATIGTSQFGVFNGMLYVSGFLGHSDTGSAPIWRSRTGNKGTWEVATPNLGNLTTYTSQLTTFENHAYITAEDKDGIHIWRSADGKNWTTVGQGLLNNPAYTNWYATTPVVFNNALYVGTNPMVFAFEPQPAYQGGQLYRSFDGVHWQLVIANGFGGTQYPSGIDILLVYHNQLYALSNDMDAVNWAYGVTYVWRSPTGNPKSWVKVNPDGMGANTTVGFSWTTIYKDELYIGNGYGFGASNNLMKMVNP